MMLPLCELIDIAVQLLPTEGTLKTKGRKRLLIVRLDSIGDFMLFLDTFKEYRKLHPAEEWEITLLGNRVWSGLAERLPYADRYLFINPRKFIVNPAYRLRTLLEIRRGQFDRVIEPTYSRSYPVGDAIVRASGASERIGSSGNLTNMIRCQKRRADLWYTQLIAATETFLPELERNAEFLRGLGLTSFRPSTPHYPREILERLPTAFISDTTTSYFVLFPGAAAKGRQWSAEGFAEVARRLHKKTLWTPVLCGGPKDVAVTRSVVGHAPELPWLNVASLTTLSQMMALLSKARMLIANETGVIHMAAAVECPTVCIMGGGHFRRFYPYGGVNGRVVHRQMNCFGCDWRCRYSTIRCISEIAIDEVWREVHSLAEEISQ